ncbi:MAG: hypothetical protein QXX55_00320 [Candidatus Pacearchaeota archaeon]
MRGEDLVNGATVKKNEENKKEENEKEKRIKKLTKLYYSRQDIQKAIFSFSQDREVVPRYFEVFGKRPDTLQYPQDVFELVKKGATSFHCSEELWEDPLKISTDMSQQQLNSLRKGWDLLIDVDSKYFDYSKILTNIILKIFRFYGIKNFGLKFSGSKGFHILIPSKSFPKEINNIKTSLMFPEWPRIITKFIKEISKNELIEKITELNAPNRDKTKYVKDSEAIKEVMPDLILVSSRHLFRAPYSLHEKTALASVVITPEELNYFQPMDADPLKAEIKNFMPNVKEGEATELLREALDWYKNENPEKQLYFSQEENNRDFKKIEVQNFSEDFLPPTIKKILEGMKDGKKRSLFILINLFRAIGIDKEELERIIYAWNEKNQPQLKKGYIKAQLSWSYRNKIVPPPNYENDYYKNLGLDPTEEELRYKNPINYIISKAKHKNYEKNKRV